MRSSWFTVKPSLKHNHRLQTKFIWMGLLLFSLSSCSNSEFSDYEKTETGLMYKFYNKGNDTTHPKYGEVVRIKMSKRSGDSTLESTNLISSEGIEQYLRPPAFKGAIEEGITKMAIGDSATFLISTDSINKFFPAKDSSKTFTPGSFLAFDIKLMDIRSVEEVQAEDEQRRQEYISQRKGKEPQELSQYLQDNKIEVKASGAGMYFIEKEKGQGNAPKDGDAVVVHYTGSFLDGTIFDSSVKRNQPFEFVVNAQGEGGVIPGWNEAIKKMKQGAVATIILPSSLAYDSSGYMDPQTGRYFIPPYAPMKFDIQLLEIKSKNKL